MRGLSDELVGLGLAVIGGWAIPALGIRMLVPTLESSSWTVTNYRGRRLFQGLGIVWVLWVLGLLLAGLAGPGRGPVGASYWHSVTEPAVLVLSAFAFGMIDDVFGTHDDKGFRGHLRSMARGRLTTGGLKLVGIGSVALLAATTAAIARGEAGMWSRAEVVGGAIAGTVLIAGSANLVNLLDLRPGRALKGYLVLFGISWVTGLAVADWRGGTISIAVNALGVAVWFVGPALAVWRFDLSERGMLGDAGANAAGALVGFALMGSLPLWGIVVAAAAIAALNLVSERVSFSQLIDHNALLTRFDRLGRPSDDIAPPELIS